MPDQQTIRAEQERRLRFLYALYDREQAGEEYARADQVAMDIGMDPIAGTPSAGSPRRSRPMI